MAGGSKKEGDWPDLQLSEPDSGKTLSNNNTNNTNNNNLSPNVTSNTNKSRTSRNSRSSRSSRSSRNTRQPPWSLAGPIDTKDQGTAYMEPEYLKYHTEYGKNQEKPIWSLAKPLPHVVRPGMRSPEEQTGREGEEEYKKRNINEEREPAEQEPPTANPPDNEQEEGKAEARATTEDSRQYLNRWSRMRASIHQELAEWLGTSLAMTLGICAGFSTYTSNLEAGSFPSLAAAWGFAFMISIYVTGGVSGGHLNPMITISMGLWRGFPPRKCFTYTLAQVLGAITGAGIAYALYHDALVNLSAAKGMPQNLTSAKQALVTLPKEFVHPATAFFVEFVGSSLLVCVIIAMGDDNNTPPGAGMNAFIIGIFITILILALGYTTGGCFNPARDFGGRVVGAMAGWGGHLFQEYHAWWVWGPWIADISGGIFGGFIYDLVIFTGPESPVNYPAKRRRRALLLKQRNMRCFFHFQKRKIPDIERAVDRDQWEE